MILRSSDVKVNQKRYYPVGNRSGWRKPSYLENKKQMGVSYVQENDLPMSLVVGTASVRAVTKRLARREKCQSAALNITELTSNKKG